MVTSSNYSVVTCQNALTHMHTLFPNQHEWYIQQLFLCNFQCFGGLVDLVAITFSDL